MLLVTWRIQLTILCGHLAQINKHWSPLHLLAAWFPLDFEICWASLLNQRTLRLFQNSFLIKKNAAISILIEIFAHLLIIFAHHCKIKIIPHNLCTILLQDKLRVCVFKAFDHQSTNYLLKGWVNFHPHKKNMRMTVSRVKYYHLLTMPEREKYIALLILFSISLSSQEAIFQD